MIDPEKEILTKLLARLNVLSRSATSDLAWLEQVPSDLSEFETMASHRQSAARAVLKSFELIEDQLNRAFRAIPKLMGEDTRRWFSRDHADYMERFGVLDDAGRWSAVVRLRNNLVHDYPLEPEVQFERLIEAIGYLPLLELTYRRLADFVQNDLPGKLI